MNQRISQQGFTLTELMVTLAIAAILIAIAIPSYSEYVRKSRRAEGVSTMLNIQMAEEKHRSNNSAYGDLNAVWGGITTTPNGYYNLAITNTSATGYTLTATAQNDQANDKEQGTSCTTLSVVVNGLTTTKTPAVCWPD